MALIAVGWPTGSGSLNSSVAGIDELQYFINTFPAAATAAGVDYYWFEGYDEPWKIVYDTPTEQYEDHWVSSCRRGTNFRDYWM
jgi:exo-beta-1,3-glucanase (GH17 family)